VPDRPPQSFRSALEQQILQRFCTEDLPESVTAAIKTKLDSYAWCDPDNRIVFEALCSLGSLTPAVTASQLPAQATRMGFPDLNWERYLGQHRADPADIRDLIEELLVAK
jgi:hypothetical protein